jgi:hypothetical protein
VRALLSGCRVPDERRAVADGDTRFHNSSVSLATQRLTVTEGHSRRPMVAVDEHTASALFAADRSHSDHAVAAFVGAAREVSTTHEYDVLESY